jgi:hypothetical protein
MSRIARIIVPQQPIFWPRPEEVVAPPVDETDDILLEDDSGFLLLESGDKLIQE